MDWSDLLTQASVSAFLGAFAAVLATELVGWAKDRLLARSTSAALLKDLEQCRALADYHREDVETNLFKAVGPRYQTTFLKEAIRIFVATRTRSAVHIHALSRFLGDLETLNRGLEFGMQSALSTNRINPDGLVRGFRRSVDQLFATSGAVKSPYDAAVTAAQGKRLKFIARPISQVASREAL